MSAGQLEASQRDPNDRRRTFVRISAAAFADFSRYLLQIADGHAAFVLLAPPRRAGGLPNALAADLAYTADQEPKGW